MCVLGWFLVLCFVVENGLGFLRWNQKEESGVWVGDMRVYIVSEGRCGWVNNVFVLVGRSRLE